MNTDPKGELKRYDVLLSTVGMYHYYAPTGAHVDALEAISALSTAEQRIEELEKEQEILVWNLAGCSTYALGYGLDEKHDESWERAALRDVKKLALKERTLRDEDKLRRDALWEGAETLTRLRAEREKELKEFANFMCGELVNVTHVVPEDAEELLAAFLAQKERK